MPRSLCERRRSTKRATNSRPASAPGQRARSPRAALTVHPATDSLVTEATGRDVGGLRLMDNESDDRNPNQRLWTGQSDHGLLVFDSSGRWEDADELGCATLGRMRGELLGMDVSALFQRIPGAAQSSDVWIALRGDGAEVPVELRANVRVGGGLVALVRDARPELLERRRQARRTRALTTLSESSSAVLRATDEPRMLLRPTSGPSMQTQARSGRSSTT